MFPVLLAAAVSAAASDSSLIDRLVAEGFENVALETRGETTTVWFEDRRSLDANAGLGQVARLIAKEGLSSDTVELFPLCERWPVLGIRVPLTGLRDYLQGRLSEPAFEARLVFEPAPPMPPADVANSSVGRLELQLTPGYAFSDKLFGYANSTLRAQLAPGWHALARVQTQFYPDWSPIHAAARTTSVFRRPQPDGPQRRNSQDHRRSIAECGLT